MSLGRAQRFLPFDHPLSLMAPEDPEIDPYKNSAFHLLHGKKKNGGIKWSAAFPPAMMVMVDDLIEVIEWGFAVFQQTIFGGE